MVEREDQLGLGLSLSLSADKRTDSVLHFNNLQMPTSSSTFLQKSNWNHSIVSSFAGGADRNSDLCRPETTTTRSFLKGIDMNRLPTVVCADEEAVVSSPNSTVSSVSGKKSERETNEEDLEIERGSSRGMSDDEDGETSRKKLRLSKEQSAILEESFKEHNTLNPKQKLTLAKRLGLRPRQVEVWFQNRRARTKLKQTEVDCEFLRRCCENLTEENRRLQKEVQELRTLKLSPHFYMQMAPPTTLTMCPSCERVAVPPSSVPSQSSMDSRAHMTAPRHISVNPWICPSAVVCRPFDAGLRHRS